MDAWRLQRGDAPHGRQAIGRTQRRWAACMGGDRVRACEASHAARVPQGPHPQQRGALLRQGERRAGKRLRGPDIAVRDGFLGGG